MKKTFKFMMMALMAIVVCAGFAACSSDDDDNNNNNPGSKDYSSVKTTPQVAFVPSMLDLFDITITANGKTETVDVNKAVETKLDMGFTTPVDAWVYSMAETTSKTPATVTVSVEVKLKSGVDLSKVEKSDYLLAPMLAYQFGSEKKTGKSPSAMSSQGVRWANLSEAQLSNFITTKTCTGIFNADGSGSITK